MDRHDDHGSEDVAEVDEAGSSEKARLLPPPTTIVSEPHEPSSFDPSTSPQPLTSVLPHASAVSLFSETSAA